jgi:hypothetical protein
MEIKAELPPFVEFEEIEIEDREATLEKGEFVGIPVDMIKVHPAGSKDCVIRNYKEWLEQKKQDASEGRFPKSHLFMIQEQYQAWKRGIPKPTWGTPLKDWKHSTPQLLKAMGAVHISTIEELALANEETIKRLGMGARSLKAKAEMFMRGERIPDDIMFSTSEVSDKISGNKPDLDITDEDLKLDLSDEPTQVHVDNKPKTLERTKTGLKLQPTT